MSCSTTIECWPASRSRTLNRWKAAWMVSYMTCIDLLHDSSIFKPLILVCQLRRSNIYPERNLQKTVERLDIGWFSPDLEWFESAFSFNFHTIFHSFSWSCCFPCLFFVGICFSPVLFFFGYTGPLRSGVVQPRHAGPGRGGSHADAGGRSPAPGGRSQGEAVGQAVGAWSFQVGAWLFSKKKR